MSEQGGNGNAVDSPYRTVTYVLQSSDSQLESDTKLNAANDGAGDITIDSLYQSTAAEQKHCRANGHPGSGAFVWLQLPGDGDRRAEVMAAALRALPRQNRPSDVVVPGLLEGLVSVNRLIEPWLTAPRSEAAAKVVSRPA